jgi:hypothetical protein
VRRWLVVLALALVVATVVLASARSLPISKGGTITQVTLPGPPAG